MDPELVAIDAGAVKIARAKRFGRLYGQERNIPRPYERPGRWSTTKNMGNLPSVMGIIQGPSRTVHAQSQVGSSWNWPPFVALLPQRVGIVQQIASQRPTPLLNLLARR